MCCRRSDSTPGLSPLNATHVPNPSVTLRISSRIANLLQICSGANPSPLLGQRNMLYLFICFPYPTPSPFISNYWNLVHSIIFGAVYKRPFINCQNFCSQTIVLTLNLFPSLFLKVIGLIFPLLTYFCLLCLF